MRSLYRICVLAIITMAALVGLNGPAAAATTTAFEAPAVFLDYTFGGVPQIPAVYVTATPENGVTSFGVANPPSWRGDQPERLRVSWRNLATGAAGAVDLEYRMTGPCDCPPPALTAPTGQGQIVATVTLVNPPPRYAITFAPGFGTFAA